MRHHPTLIEKRRIFVISTYHTSRQAFWHADPDVREARKKHPRKSFDDAAFI